MHLQDSLTTEADFTIIFENDNAKGVIRMLGVQNDESYDDFLYHDGIQWVKVADRDVAGWYHIIVVVNDAGTLVSIETEPESGIYDMYLDPSFTSFTSIRIVGGSVSDPFNVDDIRVETVPVEGFPPIVPIPVDSWITILIMISVIGVILTRMR